MYIASSYLCILCFGINFYYKKKKKKKKKKTNKAIILRDSTV